MPAGTSRRGLSPAAARLSRRSRSLLHVQQRGPTTPAPPRRRRFGLFPGRSPLLGESLLFSFPAGTKMFQFPALAPEMIRWRVFNTPGCPIRKSPDQRLFAPPRSLSQLITSFIASESQGIRHAPFFTFFIHSLTQRFLRSVGSGMIYTFSSLLLKLLFACTICHRSFIFVSYVSDGVENNGFEPLTLCVQGRCSSQLS